MLHFRLTSPSALKLAQTNGRMSALGGKRTLKDRFRCDDQRVRPRRPDKMRAKAAKLIVLPPLKILCRQARTFQPIARGPGARAASCKSHTDLAKRPPHDAH